jgi:hypothetical protein
MTPHQQKPEGQNWRWILSGLALLGLGACQTTSQARPANLQNPSPETIARVKQALSASLGRAQLELGPEDLNTSSTLSVLPPRPDPMLGRNLDMPLVFDIILQGRTCALSRRDTGQIIPLVEVKCKPAIVAR